MSKPPIAISLFSGLGGIDIGLYAAGIETRVCIEKDNMAARTLKVNSFRHETMPAASEELVTKKYPWQVIDEDIQQVSANSILQTAGIQKGEVDLVVGGPPCQTFSRSNEGERAGTNHEQGKLYEEFTRVLREIGAEAFIFENVYGLMSSNNGNDLRIILSAFEDAGYTVNHTVLNAANYGVAQTRKRLFIIGVKDDFKPTFPEPTHTKDYWAEVQDALVGFSIDESVEQTNGYLNAIGGKHGYLLNNIPAGANYQHFSDRRYDSTKEEYVERNEHETRNKKFDWRSRHWNYLLKQDPGRPAWTLQSTPGTYVGPFHWRSRQFSFLEQLRLMDLPIEYYIAGNPKQVQRQIGNAAPPRLIREIATHLLNQLNQSAMKLRENPTPVVSYDGGTKHDFQIDNDYTIKNSISPWQYADAIISSLDTYKEICVKAQGKHIPRALDIAELVRRNKNTTIDFERKTQCCGDTFQDVTSAVTLTIQ